MRRKPSKRRSNRPRQPVPTNPAAAPTDGKPPVRPTRRGQRGKSANGKRPRTRFGRLGCILNPMYIFGCLGLAFICTCVSTFGGVVVYNSYAGRVEDGVDELEAKLNDLDDPNNSASFETTYIYDRNGNQLYEVFGEGRRRRVPLDEIPDYLIWATISIEDDSFYENVGVDVPSILRSTRDYLQAGEVVSGASTITQQLVRNIAFEPEYRQEQSIERKLDEAMLSIVLTQRLTKDEILELYLNEIYYGNLAYGIEAAAQVYFGKPATQLELHEAALLAGLPQSPSQLDPLDPDPLIQDKVTKRQQLVLDLMVEEGYITEQEATNAKQQTLSYSSPEIPLDQAPHFVLYAQDEAEEILVRLGYEPELLSNGGLQIFTSIDMDLQEVAEDAAVYHVNQLRSAHDLTNSAVIALHPPTGEIYAMVGSVDYNNDAIDGRVNVTIAQRQPGSTMKPFTYAAAMEQGWTAGTIVWDTNVDIGIAGQPTYSPDNYDRRQHGPVRVRAALANSYNIPAVKTLRKVGVQYLIDFMHRFGVQSLNRGAENYGLSLTLGGGEVTLLELTNAYANFARDGVFVEPHAVVCIKDKKDNIIYQYENRCDNYGGGTVTGRTFSEFAHRTPVLDPRIAFVISDILSDNSARTPAMGANSPLNTGNLLTSVKTGTTNDFKDNWTVGYTDDLAIGVWSGNNDNHAMVNISGLQGAAPIWKDTMVGMYQVYAGRFGTPTLPVPGGLTQQRICNINTLTDPSGGCSSKISEWYLDGAVYLPDGQGGLTPVDVSTPPRQASDFGPQYIEIEPGLIQSYVRPVTPEQAAVLTGNNGNIATPKYCLVPVEILPQVGDASLQLFIDMPIIDDEKRGAYRFAHSANDPILPQFACTGDTVVAAPPPNVANVTGYISSPQAGDTASGNIPVIGVVQYPNNEQMTYYKIEVIGGPFANWTTLGSTHNNQVPSAGQLELFQASALPPGSYRLQLVILGSLGEYKTEVSINLVAP